MAEEIEVEAGEVARPLGRHIRKRALKNKALSVAFNEKDLRDYVGGFHKRKKKRRKEAQKQQEEAQRRKRIENRKKRKLERELVYGGAPPINGSAENDECEEEDEENEPIASISGTTTYDDGNMKVTVTTSELSHEEEIYTIDNTKEAAVPQSTGADKKHNVPVSKSKAFKRAAKPKSRPKPQSKRDKKKGKKKNKKRT
ncbi:hypothetical protein CJ030_MR2G026715 [Morella rubra]|uniref:Ribosomal RNA-processing protein 17 n=1 Tax=Morella rubra TaxID=262757 RepID=A0A6A1W9F4_9ROSI|nr:hypothetical protein CJ030_MR2G026715 [Morella rubra]